MASKFIRQPGDAIGRQTSVAFLTAVVLLASVAATAVAAQGSNSVTIMLEGKPLTTAGTVVDGKTLVPLGPLGTELEFTVDVASSEDRISVSKADKRITLAQGRSVAAVNGHEFFIYDRPQMLNGQLMVPLRFLLETMGYEVVWQGGPQNWVDLRPIEENDLIIGTARERLETATLKVDVQYPKIKGLDPKVQDPINAFLAERVKPAIEQGYESDEANREYSASIGHTLRTEVVLNYRVAYNQKGLMSLVLDDYLYTGGAHGNTGRHGYTADIATGKTYSLKGLFKDGTDYVALISSEVAKQIESRELTLLNPFEAIREDQDFYIEGDTLVIYFQQYELMAYAYGFPEFRIPMSALMDVLAPELATISWPSAE